MKSTVINLRRAGTGALAGVVLAGLSLSSLGAFAQDVENIETGTAAPAAQEPQKERLPVTMSAGVSYQSETDVDGGDGKFSMTRVTAGLGLPIRVSDQMSVNTSFKYEFAKYDFKNVTDPWQNIDTFSLASMLQWKADEHWSYYGGALVRVSAESGADWGSAWTGGGLIGVNYTFNDKLTLGGGLGLVSQLQNSPRILPLITANWKINDDWRLKAGFIDVATTGYGVDVAWDFAKDWVASFGLQFHDSRFRIEGTGVSKDGVGEEKAAVLYAAATWHACSAVDLNAFAGIAAGGSLRLENHARRKIFDEDYDATPTIGLKASIRL